MNYLSIQSILNRSILWRLSIMNNSNVRSSNTHINTLSDENNDDKHLKILTDQSDNDSKTAADMNNVNDNTIETHSHNVCDIDDVDQENKNGNYVLTFGNIGSGKSTLQQWLVAWLRTKGIAEVTFEPVNGSHMPVEECQKMVIKTTKGCFPDSTAKGNAKEYKISITPSRGKLPSLAFSFFEISGEELKEVVPDKSFGYTPTLPEYMNGFLANPKIRFSLLIVTDVEKHSLIKRSKKNGMYRDLDEDHMICSFLDYLRNNFDNKFFRAPVLICLAKWDKAAGIYENTDSYLKDALPQTYNRILLMKKRKIMVNIVAHSVGAVKVSDKGEAFVPKPNFKSTEKIAKWIYSSFTHKKIKNDGFFTTIIKIFA